MSSAIGSDLRDRILEALDRRKCVRGADCEAIAREFGLASITIKRIARANSYKVRETGNV